MAESMTYDSLVEDLKSYVNRSDTDFTDQIPRLIMMAENRIASKVRGLGYLKYAQFSLTVGDPVVTKPARWRETATLSITVNSETVFLFQRSYGFCRTYWPNQTLTDVPEYYSDYNYENLLITPTPDVAYDAEIAYYERPIPLDSTHQTNWTTQYAPQLILYGTLMEAQPWIKREDKIQVFQGLYNEAAADVTTEAMRRLNGDASLVKRED